MQFTTNYSGVMFLKMCNKYSVVYLSQTVYKFTTFISDANVAYGLVSSKCLDSPYLLICDLGNRFGKNRIRLISNDEFTQLLLLRTVSIGGISCYL